jgi:hypothetical protein
MLAFLTWFLSMPLAAAQAKLAKLPHSAGDARAFCSRVDEVRGRDAFAQTFLLEQNDGGMETVPFSRWTKFFKISPDLRGRNLREIEPTDILLGDRLCVLLDPSGATASLILVFDRVGTSARRASVGTRLSDRKPAIGIAQNIRIHATIQQSSAF